MTGSKRDRPEWIRYSGVGIEFAAAVGGFAAVGYWIDRHYDSGPWGLVLGAALGLIGGTYNLIRESMAAFKPRTPPNRGGKEDRSDQP